MNKEEKIMCNFLKEFTNKVKVKKDNIQDIDWYKLEEIYKYNLIEGLVYKILKDSSVVPTDRKTKLKKNFESVVMHNLLLKRELDNISTLFQKNRIEFIVFKGASLFYQGYYKTGIREFADIDILVKEEDKIKAVEILKQTNYYLFEKNHSKKYLEKFSSQLPFVKKIGLINSYIDLHWQVLEKTDSYNILTDDLFKYSIKKGNKRFLCPEQEIIVLSTHLAHHDLFKRPLKYLIDISLLLGKKIDWDFLIKTCKKWNASSNAYLVLKKLEILLNQKVPTNVMSELYRDSNKFDLFLKKILIENNILKIKRIKFGIRQALNEFLLSKNKFLLIIRFISF